MDIPIVKQRSRIWLLGGVCLMILVIVMLMIPTERSISINNLRFSAVKQGDFDVTVNGFGKFVAIDNQVLTAPFSGTVKQLEYRAGNWVKAGDVIAEIENQQIVLAFQEAYSDWQLATLRVDKKKLELEQQTKQQEASLRHAIAELELSELKYQAKEKLFIQQIIPELEIKQEYMQLRQQKDSLTLKRSETAQLATQVVQTLELENKELTLIKQRMLARQADLNRLSILAPFSGRLDNLNLFIGQSLRLGDQLAVIKGESIYTAKVKVAQKYSPQLNVGQKAYIKFLDQEVEASISTILPGVNQGFVVLELALDGAMSSVKENMELKVSIVLETIKDTLFVDKPTGLVFSEQVDLFVKDESLLRKTRVNILRLTENYLVLSPHTLAPKTEVVVSDTHEIAMVDTIEIEG